MIIDSIFNNPSTILAVGLLAFVVMAISFQLNVRQHILYTQVFGMTLLGIHLYLLGALTGAMMMVVMIIRNLIFAQKERVVWAAHQVVFWVVLAAVTIMGIVTWTGLESLSAIAGSWLATFAFWTNEPRRIRALVLLSAFGWAPYSIFTESYPMLLLQVFILSSIFIAMWRYDRDFYRQSLFR